MFWRTLSCKTKINYGRMEKKTCKFNMNKDKVKGWSKEPAKKHHNQIGSHCCLHCMCLQELWDSSSNMFRCYSSNMLLFIVVIERTVDEFIQKKTIFSLKNKK